MNPSADAANRHDVVYPPKFAARPGWQPSTITRPISPLEFDLRAVPFTLGFRLALRALLRRDVDVAVRRSGGRLWTLIANGQSASAEESFVPPDDFHELWASTVQPTTVQVLNRLAAASRPDDAIIVLRQAVEWIARLTYLHHTMLLSARVAIGEFAELAVAEGVLPTELDSLCLLAGSETATTAAANRLWHLRKPAQSDPVPEEMFVAALADLGQEGEGYGLRHPSWLEDVTVPVAIARLYATAAPEQSPAHRLGVAQETSCALRATAGRRVSRLPRAVAYRYERIARRARSAMLVTEDHAPLMHCRLGHELRRLVLTVGERLVDTGALDAPDEVFLLHLAELVEGHTASFRDLLAVRRSEMETPIASVFSQAGDVDGLPDPFGDSRTADYIRQVFGATRAAAASSSSVLRGEPASPGREVGRVRRLREHLDLRQVRNGEVLVTSNNSSVWSFALPVAAAVASPGGSRFGHLAALARDYARPAVVGLSDLDRLQDGDLVEVDGNAGAVTLIRRSERTEP